MTKTDYPSSRIAILDPLRGIAALAVMWFHFTNGGHLLDKGSVINGWLKYSGQYGWAGVDFFFVISGFVLPYALFKGKYRLRNFGKFLLKRLIRLEPPYLVSLAAIILLLLIAPLVPGYGGDAFSIEWSRLLLHLGYLNTYFGYESYNPVYWTLAIELQFYLGIALLFPLLVSERRWLRSMFPLVLMAMSLIPCQESIIFRYLPLFVFGIVCFQYFIDAIGFRLWLMLMILAAAFSFSALGIVATSAGLMAALTIAWSKHESFDPNIFGQKFWRVLAWAGTISYSLYLIHVPIGGRIVNIGTRFADNQLAVVITLLLAIALTLLAAWILYRLIEKPSQKHSASLKFSRSTV